MVAKSRLLLTVLRFYIVDDALFYIQTLAMVQPTRVVRSGACFTSGYSDCSSARVRPHGGIELSVFITSVRLTMVTEQVEIIAQNTYRVITFIYAA